MLVGYSVKLVSIIALYLYMYFENKRRDRAAMEGLNSTEKGIENGMLVCYYFLVLHNGLCIQTLTFTGPNGNR